MQISREFNAASLREAQIENRKHLEEFMLAGNIEAVIQTQTVLKELELFIKTADIQDLKSKLEAIEDELQETRQDQELLEQMRADANAALAPLITQVDEARVNVMKLDSSLYQTDARRTSLLESRRQFKKDLQKLIGDIRNENSK